jgi:hypothetical protein
VTVRAPIPLAEKLEKQWDNDLFSKNGLATTLGWDSYWTFRSKGSRAGFPDRTACRERIIYAELKRELTGKKSEDANRQPSAFQVYWLDKLAAAGGEVYLWRPSDLDEVARVLGKRWHYSAYNRSLQVDGKGWQPASLWIPSVGRSDSAT